MKKSEIIHGIIEKLKSYRAYLLNYKAVTEIKNKK